MIKTAIFAAGVACGCALSSAMTDEQRRQLADRIGLPVRRLADAPATQRLGASVRQVAETATDRVTSGLDGIAEALEPDDRQPPTESDQSDKPGIVSGPP